MLRRLVWGNRKTMSQKQAVVETWQANFGLREHMHARQNKLKLILLAYRKRNINYRMVRKCLLMVDVTYSFEASLVVHEQSILGLHIQFTEAMLQLFTLTHQLNSWEISELKIHPDIPTGIRVWNLALKHGIYGTQNCSWKPWEGPSLESSIALNPVLENSYLVHLLGLHSKELNLGNLSLKNLSFSWKQHDLNFFTCMVATHNMRHVNGKQ